MNKVKSFWDGLTKIQRLNIIKKNRFWDGLIDFEYDLIPKDLKRILSQEMKENDFF